MKLITNHVTLLKSSRSTHPADIPPRVTKEFALELTEPLTHIFNCCLNQGIFPAVWKTSSVSLIPKTPNAKSLDQLRPISLTRLNGKIFESFLAEWTMVDFYPHIDEQQYGNVKDSSTTHYLVDVVDTVLKGIDEAGHYATLCAIDFTKAFDRINHNIAVQKLIDIGIRPSIIPVISSFLCNRTQSVRIKGRSSACQSISGGVPQGTKFGPTIFFRHGQ